MAPKTRKPPKELADFLTTTFPDAVGEWPAFCPIHESDKEHDPSASFNFDKGVWKCFAGCGEGRIKNLIEKLKLHEMSANGQKVGGVPLPPVADLDFERTKRRGEQEPNFRPTQEMVTKFYGQLQNADNKERLELFMRKRGLDQETINQYEIGWNAYRRAYTIPIKDAQGRILNIRFYRIDPKADQAKYFNYKQDKKSPGCGGLFLYPVPEPVKSSKRIVLAEGELDTLLLIQNGVPAVTITGGAGNWNKAWNGWFKNKRVYIAYDRDKAGEKGALRVAKQLRNIARAVHIITLPYDYQEEHGRDVTDFLVEDGHGIDEFKKLLNDSKPFSQKEKVEKKDPKRVTVLESYDSDLVGAPLELTAIVVGRQTGNHIAPKHLIYRCSQDAGEKCERCPMNSNDGLMEGDLAGDDPQILKYMGATDDEKDALVREILNIVKCNQMEYEVRESHSLETLVVRSSIDPLDEQTADQEQRRVIAVGPHDTLPSQNVRFVGMTVPSPKDQRNEFLAYQVDKDQNAFDAFEMTPEIGDQLRMFQPSAGQSVGSKLKDIADDLVVVTQIRGRTDLHIAMDLVYHSVISYQFAGKHESKGWLDLLIVGDTRTGKSETAKKLTAHYGLGTAISCEAASFSGVVGGATQIFGKEWQIVWGAIPLHDRQLVVLDEAAGLSQEEIAQMSSVRSEGLADIRKISSQRASARTRLIWLANPREGRRMADYIYGFEAIEPLIGNPEDIARFDFVMAVSSDEVPNELINQLDRGDDKDQKYPEKNARDLILWAWSRMAEVVLFEPGAEEAVIAHAMRMGSYYISKPPLIQVENFRYKLARIAVAIAARLFSTDDSYTKLVVKKEHVDTAAKFIEYLYKKETFGYGEISRQAHDSRTDAQQSEEWAKDYMRRNKHVKMFLKRRSTFTRQMMEEEMNTARESANGYISELSSHGLLNRDRFGRLVTDPVLNSILRRMR